jgi:hypothetical protein
VRIIEDRPHIEEQMPKRLKIDHTGHFQGGAGGETSNFGTDGKKTTPDLTAMQLGLGKMLGRKNRWKPNWTVIKAVISFVKKTGRINLGVM